MLVLPVVVIMAAQSLTLRLSAAERPVGPFQADLLGSENVFCERITVPLCKDVLYNHTRLPNQFGHEDQDKVNADIQHYKPLVTIKCSPHVHFFICALFTPMCDENMDIPITACRSVCEKVKKDCTPSLEDFGFSWPATLNCSRLPQDGTLCMHPEGSPASELDGSKGVEKPINTAHHEYSDQRNTERKQTIAKSRCPRPYQLDLDPNDPSVPCAPRCDAEILFEKPDKDFASIWMGVLAGLCSAVTGVTIVTCLLDYQRFPFPQRSIVFLALCYHLYSWGFLLRVILGYDKTSCQETGDGEKYLIAGDLNNPTCVIIFFILYYFTLARSIWWVVLTFTWYLAAKKKWSDEAIENWNSYYHLVAWGLPALLSIAVLITQWVDAHELTGLCMVGNQKLEALGGFVILPHFLLLLAGISFLVLGYCGLRSVQNQLRHQGYPDQDLAKLERLKQRIAIFSVLYVIPSLAFVGCLVYHMWTLIQLRAEEAPPRAQCGAEDYACAEPKLAASAKPRVEVYMLQIFMDLIVGITSGMWIFSRKTFMSWKHFVCCTRTPGLKQPIQNLQPAAMPLMVSSGTTRPTDTLRLPSPCSARTESSGRKARPPPQVNHYLYRHPQYLAGTESSENSRGI